MGLAQPPRSLQAGHRKRRTERRVSNGVDSGLLSMLLHLQIFTEPLGWARPCPGHWGCTGKDRSRRSCPPKALGQNGMMDKEAGCSSR